MLIFELSKPSSPLVSGAALSTCSLVEPYALVLDDLNIPILIHHNFHVAGSNDSSFLGPQHLRHLDSALTGELVYCLVGSPCLQSLVVAVVKDENDHVAVHFRSETNTRCIA